MPALSLTQQIAGPPDLKIPHGDLDPRSQIRKLADGGQPFLRHFLKKLIPPVQEKCISHPVGAAHTPPQLIELGQAEPVRILDDHRIGVRDVQSGLNDRGRYQDVNIPVDKVIHNVFQLALPHLSVGIGHRRVRQKTGKAPGHIRNVTDPVIDIVNLSAPGELPLDRLTDHLVAVFDHISLDGHPVLGRLLQHTHIPDPDQAHMERSGDRRGRQREDVHVFPEFLDLLFMCDAEPLLLVNDQEPQVFESHIFRKDPVGADHNIHQPLFQILRSLFLLRG